MKDGQREDRPAQAPKEVATQAGEARARWAWTEPAVWTDRMLTALETGVKGGVWYRLVDTFPNLDKRIRMRPRSIPRRRIGLKGRGRGSDHQRWPNAFFDRYGLFSPQAAHAGERQSSRR